MFAGKILQIILLCGKCPNTEFFSGPYFPVFGPNAGKYGLEETPYLDTFHAVYKNVSRDDLSKKRPDAVC